MIVALTGATGFVGSHLARRLLERGHRLRILTHRQLPIGFDANQASVVRGGMEDKNSLDRLVTGTDAVIHLVGLIVEQKGNTFRGTVAEGTKRLVDSCLKAGTPRLIYLSALGASKQAATEYHRTKYQAEQAIIQSGLDYVIFRSSLIYGPGDGFVSMLRKIISIPPLVIMPGNGKYKLQPVYIDDITDLMEQALINAEASKSTFDVGGPEQLTYAKISRAVAKASGKKRLFVGFPMLIMRAAARILEAFLRPAPITRDQLTMLEMGNTGDISRTSRVFSFAPVTFEDGLKLYIR